MSARTVGSEVSPTVLSLQFLALWVTSCQSPLCSLHGDCGGNLWGLVIGNLIVTKKREGAHNNQHLDLGRPSSYLQ